MSNDFKLICNNCGKEMILDYDTQRFAYETPIEFYYDMSERFNFTCKCGNHIEIR